MGIVRKFIEFVRNKIITRRGFAPGTITKIMAKYILSKKAKGKKYQYTVTDEKGNVISTRTSAVIMWRVPPTANFILGGWT